MSYPIPRDFLSQAIRHALFATVALSATAGSGPALAQDQAPAPAEPETTELDRIEVTGSRIKRTEVETSQPIFTMSREDIAAQGLTSVGDVIQNITTNGSTLNTTMNNGGNGETQVSLRNLGSQRTLVLVNGRRWVGGTGLGGAVDLNTIPTAAVERIEVLKDGASAIYGSDAIAGVVNVILRKDFDGAEFNGYLGGYDKGDGFKQSYDITIGSTGDRFSAMFGAGYVKEEPVMAGDREISAVPTYKTGNAFGSTTTPNGRVGFGAEACQRQNDAGQLLWIDPATGAPTSTVPTFDEDGMELKAMVTAGNQLPDAITLLCQPGTLTRDGQAGGNAVAAWRNFLIPDDIYNFAPDNYLVTPQERISIFGRATLNITDNVSGFIQATYNNRKSEQLLAAMPVTTGFAPGTGVQAQTITISRYSLYNPFGEDITRVQRRTVETGGRSFNQNVDTYAFTGGLEGSFEIGERFFSWDAGMTYARNEQANTTFGLFNVQALRQSLGPSMLDPSTGNPICVTTPGDASTAILGCVPLNLLGGRGSITQDQLDFSSFVAHDNLGYEMKQYFANISGEIVELPGGMLAFAAGVEKRDESGFNSPDALIASGNTTGNALAPTEGAYGVNEAYLELQIPVLKDVPFAQELEFSLASRFSDYSNFGNTTNSKFGFKWRPIEDLLIRGNWAQGFRAPSINELFGGLSDSFPTIGDPCSTTFGGAYNSLTAEQKARCHAQGVPVGGYDQGNPQIRTSVGGNPNLEPEKSETRTLGFVYSPGWLEGFDISLDWWKIELEDTITAFGGQTVLDECVLNGDPNFCALFTRNPSTGQVATLLSAGVNFGEATVEGYDMTMNYRLPETAWGRFSVSLDTTYMTQFKIGDDDNRVGEYFSVDNHWRIRSNLLARWEKGDWGATWSSRYYSRQEEPCPFYYNDYGFGELCNDAIVDENNAVQPGSFNRMGGTTYHDVTVYTKLPWNAKVTLGVNNLFDKQPPVSFTTFANSFDPQYEIPGQFFYLQYNQKF